MAGLKLCFVWLLFYLLWFLAKIPSFPSTSLQVRAHHQWFFKTNKAWVKLNAVWCVVTIVGLFLADCHSLVACWPCFLRSRTPRLKKDLFMVDAFALSNMREAIGLRMFMCHVSPSYWFINSHILDNFSSVKMTNLSFKAVSFKLKTLS